MSISTKFTSSSLLPIVTTHPLYTVSTITTTPIGFLMLNSQSNRLATTSKFSIKAKVTKELVELGLIKTLAHLPQIVKILAMTDGVASRSY